MSDSDEKSSENPGESSQEETVAFGGLSLTTAHPASARSAQDFGAVLVLESNRFIVTAASANLRQWLGASAEEVTGKPVSRFFTDDLMEFVTREAGRSVLDGRSPAMMPYRLSTGRECWVRLNRGHDSILVEFEDANGHHPERMQAGLGDAALAFKRADTIAGLLQESTDRLRRLTGFDRTMILRFAPDGNIEVLSEALSEDWDPDLAPVFAGTWFPACHIPNPARLLSMNAPARIVADIDSPSVPLVTSGSGSSGRAGRQGADLGRSALRDVSDGHRDWLRAAGVKSAMTFSLLRKGQLWGLLVFHHRTPLRMPPPARVSVQLLLDLITARLEILEERQTWAHRAEHRTITAALLRQLDEEKNFARGLTEGAANLADLFSAGGAAILFDDRVASVGNVPKPEMVRRLGAWLRDHVHEKLYCTDNIAGLPEFFRDESETASGVLALFLNSDRSRILLWFRPAILRHRCWAKQSISGICGEESLQGHSAPWAEWELSEARDLILPVNDIYLKFQAETLAEANLQIRRQLAEKEELASALAQAKLDVELILGAVGEGICSVSPDRQVTLFNRAAARLSGVPSAEAIGRPLKEILIFPDCCCNGEIVEERCADAVSLTLKDGKTRELSRQTLRLTRGGSLLVDFTVTPVIAEGQRTGAVIVFRDTSRQQAAEESLRARKEELQRSNAELEQFAYVTSHDLREPLRMVDGYLRLIERRMKDLLDEDTREFLGYARDGAKRMDRQIRDLLEYSRVGRKGKPFETLEMSDVVANALHTLSVTIEETGVEIHLPEAFPRVSGDDNELSRLFQNLLGNAIKYRSAERPAVISLAVMDNGENWEFAIEDNGIGIPENDQERIFMIFQRLHRAEDYEGTGIGLAVCKKIVERHGGHIRVESEPDKFSRFLFTIPKLAAPASESAQNSD